MTGWTDERIDRATVMATAGHSATEIAIDIGGGLSRNAVIGKLNRMKVPLGSRDRRGGVKPRKPRTRVARLATARAQQSAPKTGPVHYLEAAASESVDLPPDVSPFACTLMDLTHQTCRWPLGDPIKPDFRFCGAPKHGELAYCARHCAMAYQPYQRRERPKPQGSWRA